MLNSKPNRLFLFMLTLALFNFTGSLQAQTHQIGVVVNLVYDSSHPALNEALIQPSIESLNVVSAFGGLSTPIEFIVAKINYINDPNYVDVGESQIDALTEAYNDPDLEDSAINLYFVPNVSNTAVGLGTLPEGIDYLFNNVHTGAAVIIENSAAATSTVPHEFGHYFGLVHTDAITVFPTGVKEVPYGHPNFGQKKVQGDLIVDTPAEPPANAGSNYDSQCVYDGQEFYDQAQQYPYDDPDPTGTEAWPPSQRPSGANFMTIGTGTCRTKFTSGQKNMIDSVLTGTTTRFPLADRSALLNQNWVKFSTLLDSDNSDLDGEIKVGSVTLKSGEYFPFDTVNPETKDLEALDERLQSNSAKHHDWDEVLEDFTLIFNGFDGSSVIDFSAIYTRVGNTPP